MSGGEAEARAKGGNAAKERKITTYGAPLSQVTSSKYMGRVIVTEEDDWLSVVRNLWRARQKWLRMTHILISEGADAQTSGQIKLAVVQSVLMYGSETWVLTPRMKRVFGGFHHRVDLRLTGRQLWKGRDGGWVYTPMEDAMA